MIKTSLLYKTLIVGIIILFICITLSPVITAVDNDTDDVDESSGNSEIGTSEDYEEIITFIKGRVDLNWIERRGFFRGEALLICRYQSGLINLSGYRHSESGIEYYNELIEKGLVYAHCFIGYSNGYWSGMLDPGIVGIAIGNILWEEYA